MSNKETNEDEKKIVFTDEMRESAIGLFPMVNGETVDIVPKMYKTAFPNNPELWPTFTLRSMNVAQKQRYDSAYSAMITKAGLKLNKVQAVVDKYNVDIKATKGAKQKAKLEAEKTAKIQELEASYIVSSANGDNAEEKKIIAICFECVVGVNNLLGADLKTPISVKCSDKNGMPEEFIRILHKEVRNAIANKIQCISGLSHVEKLGLES